MTDVIRKSAPRWRDVKANTAIHSHSILVLPREPEASDARVAMAADARSNAFGFIVKDMTEGWQRKRLIDVGNLGSDWRTRSLAVKRGSFRVHEHLQAFTIDCATKAQREDIIAEVSSFGGGALEVFQDFALALPALATIDAPAAWPDGSVPDWLDATGIARAHELGLRGADTLFGMLDTGVDADHFEFRNRVVPFRHVPYRYEQRHRDVRGFDTSGHGTHVAAILTGQRCGIAPDATLRAAYVIESETLATSASRVARGLDWLIRTFEQGDNRDRRKIINLSLGFDQELVKRSNGANPTFLDRSIQAINIIVNRAVRSGRAVVFAAIGNDGPGHACYPAMSPGVVSVGAANKSLQVADFSATTSDGGGPMLHGLGVDVVSAVERSCDGDDLYATMSGTSMATPYCAAIAALTWERHPQLSPMELTRKLVDDALPIEGGRFARFVP